MTDEVQHCQAALVVLERFAKTGASAPTKDEFATLKACFDPIIAELELDVALAWQSLGKHLLWPLHADWPVWLCPEEWRDEYRELNANKNPHKSPRQRATDKCRALAQVSPHRLPTDLASLLSTLHRYEKHDQDLRREIANIADASGIHRASNLMALATKAVPESIGSGMDSDARREFCLAVIEDGFCPSAGRKSWTGSITKVVFLTTWLSEKLRMNSYTIFNEQKWKDSNLGFRRKSLDAQFPKAWRTVGGGIAATFDDGQYDAVKPRVGELIRERVNNSVGKNAAKMRGVLVDLNSEIVGVVSGDPKVVSHTNRYRDIRQNLIGSLCENKTFLPFVETAVKEENEETKSSDDEGSSNDGDEASQHEELDGDHAFASESVECAKAHASAFRAFVVGLPRKTLRFELEHLLQVAAAIAEYPHRRIAEAKNLYGWISLTGEVVDHAKTDSEIMPCLLQYQQALEKLYSCSAIPHSLAVSVFMELAGKSAKNPLR